MAIQINRLTNANVYIDGANLLGCAEEINLPTLKSIMAEHKALGMFGKVEFVSGLDKMEAKIKWNSFYSNVLKKCANPYKAVQIQCRSSVESYNSTGRVAQVPAVCFLTGQYKDFPLGTFKQHDNVELESNLSITAIKLRIDGIDIIEVDVLANIYKVDGVDILAQYRANLGI